MTLQARTWEWMVPALSLAAVLAGTSPALAADAKLDLAQDHVTAAINDLQAADVPNDKGKRCRKQVDKAIKQLGKVQARINAAKACQDGTAPAKAGGRRGAKTQ